MLKRFLSIALISAVICSFSACDTSTTTASTPAEPSETPKASDTLKASPATNKKDVSLEILNTSMGEDYAGKPILIVEYEFSHNKKEATAFSLCTNDKAYQNGVECGGIVISDAIDAQQQLNNVQPNTPYKLKVGYALQDKTSPVEIEVKEFIGDKVLLKKTVELA